MSFPDKIHGLHAFFTTPMNPDYFYFGSNLPTSKVINYYLTNLYQNIHLTKGLILGVGCIACTNML